MTVWHKMINGKIFLLWECPFCGEEKAVVYPGNIEDPADRHLGEDYRDDSMNISIEEWGEAIEDLYDGNWYEWKGSEEEFKKRVILGRISV